MQKIDAILKKIGDLLDRLIFILGGGGLIVAVAVYAYNILDWWLFGKRIATADEIALMGLVWASYVGMGLLYRCHGHCTMDFIVEAIKAPKVKVLMNIIRNLLVLAVSIFAVYYSWKLSIKSFNKLLQISKIPYFYCDIAFTVGYAHLTLVAFVDMLHNIMLFLPIKREEKGVD